MQVVDGENTEEYRDMGTEELQSGAASIELKAGEMSLHANSVWHASVPYVSGDPRIGLCVRFCSPTVEPPKLTSALLARGSCEFSNYMLESAPAEDMGVSEKEQHRSSLEHHPLRNAASEGSVMGRS